MLLLPTSEITLRYLVIELYRQIEND